MKTLLKFDLPNLLHQIKTEGISIRRRFVAYIISAIALVLSLILLLGGMQLLCIGIITKVAVQTLLNFAVITNTIPNTGIPLPFFSYGGTSLIIQLLEVGIVLSISRTSQLQKR